MNIRELQSAPPLWIALVAAIALSLIALLLSLPVWKKLRTINVSKLSDIERPHSKSPEQLEPRVPENDMEFNSMSGFKDREEENHLESPFVRAIYAYKERHSDSRPGVEGVRLPEEMIDDDRPFTKELLAEYGYDLVKTAEGTKMAIPLNDIVRSHNTPDGLVDHPIPLVSRTPSRVSDTGSILATTVQEAPKPSPRPAGVGYGNCWV